MRTESPPSSSSSLSCPFFLFVAAFLRAAAFFAVFLISMTSCNAPRGHVCISLSPISTEHTFWSYVCIHPFDHRIGEDTGFRCASLLDHIRANPSRVTPTLPFSTSVGQRIWESCVHPSLRLDQDQLSFDHRSNRFIVLTKSSQDLLTVSTRMPHADQIIKNVPNRRFHHRCLILSCASSQPFLEQELSLQAGNPSPNPAFLVFKIAPTFGST